MDSWGKFIDGYLINNVKGDTTISKACDHAALIGNEGTVWAATQGFELNEASQIEVAKEDGSKETITINELDNILDCLLNKGLCSLPGGVHFLGTKWVSTDGFSGEGYYTQYFKNQDGGAAITRTNKGNLILATWNSAKEAIVTKEGQIRKVKQSVGYCNNAVDDLSKVLVENNL